MKRAISLFLSLIMLFGAAFAVNLTASADEATNVEARFSGEPVATAQAEETENGEKAAAYPAV